MFICVKAYTVADWSWSICCYFPLWIRKCGSFSGDTECLKIFTTNISVNVKKTLVILLMYDIFPVFLPLYMMSQVLTGSLLLIRVTIISLVTAAARMWGSTREEARDYVNDMEASNVKANVLHMIKLKALRE